MATYVDDIIIVANDPIKYLNKLKNIFPIRNIELASAYYLGNGIEMKENGTMKISSKKYTNETITRYESKYGMLKKQNIPAIIDDHPKMDDTPLLNEDGIRHFQSNIGICQWISTAGRFDITYVVSSLRRFAHQLREGHLERSEKILGYLKKYSKRGYIVDPRDPIVDIEYE